MGNVLFLNRVAVNGYPTLIDVDRVTGYTNDSFDKVPAWIVWVLKHHNVPTVRLCKLVDQLVDDDVLTVVEVGLHATAVNFKSAGGRVDSPKDEDGQ